MTFDNNPATLLFEPNAALPADRIKALRLAHGLGIKTWASIEPVVVPMQSLHLINMSRDCVDEYRIGKLNYDARAKTINWRNFAICAIETCEAQGSKYVLKKDLADYLK